MGILNNSNAISVDSGYDITDSLRFRSSASAYLNRTPASDGNRKTFTVSMWVKRGKLGVEQKLITAHGGNDNNGYFELKFNSSDQLYFGVYTTGSTSAAVFRDPSSWYHVVLKVDTTQASSANRVKVYVNNTDHTVDVGATLAQNTDLAWNRNVAHSIGRDTRDTNNYIDGYITEIHNVDGTALTPSDFGETDNNGTWIPKKYLGSYGTNGFYLPMKPTTQATGFNTVLYTGNGGTQDITGVGFTPDLVWVKNRDESSRFNLLTDTIRGATKSLASNLNVTEADTTYSNGLTAFGTDGFSVGNLIDFNGSADKMVAWCWDAGGSTVTNTDGDITSSVRANSSAGFSIARYSGSATQGDTVGHGLSSAPQMVICKTLNDNGYDWVVYHSGLSDTSKVVYLNLTAGESTSDNKFDSTAPTDSVVTLGNHGTNLSGTNNQIMYCFADVTGYQKIGSYTGNGSATGPTITTGFRPAFVLIKNATTGGVSWVINDNTRGEGKDLNASDSNAESFPSPKRLTFTDTGFTLTSSASSVNQSGANHIYLAIAETRDAKFNFDASGNKNNWTANNINSNASGETTYDIMSDVPTLTDTDTANFATLNPNNAGTNSDVTNGNLKIANASSHSTIYPTNMPTTGKYYFECKMAVHAAAGGLGFRTDTNKAESAYAEEANKYFLYLNNSNAYIVSETSNVALGSNLNSGTATFQVAIDFDASEYYFGVNNTWYSSAWATTGNPATGANPTYNLTDGTKMFPFLHTGGLTWTVNFGQQPFAYTPPTGFKKINAYNLPDSTIEDGSEYFNTILYAGNSSTNAITDVGFQPDWVWYKRRTGANDNTLIDSVRGGANALSANGTAAEYQFGGNDLSFTSTGFTVTDTGTQTNASGENYVAWNWKANGTAVSNTDGTITSTVSANPTAGFSVVTYTGNATAGATVGHGLGVAPAMVIVKSRSATESWEIAHQSLAATQTIRLNSTAAASTTADFNSTRPSATVFTIGSFTGTNQNSGNYVAYCFAEVEGYSKFGSYTGNGSTDGPFVYTGFRPAFVLIKNIDDTHGWQIYDSTRSSYNVVNDMLSPNVSSAEYSDSSDYKLDFLSNGFKPRTTDAWLNANNQTMIYMAFAENPFKNSNAR